MLYSEIEETRFKNRLIVKFEIEKQIQTLFFSSLLLQHLVENSIKYAIVQMFKVEVIEVIAECQQGYLQMEVTDNGPVQDPAYLNQEFKTKGQIASNPTPTGVGVQKIVYQLHFLYSDNHSSKIIRALTALCCVQISIPLDHS